MKEVNTTYGEFKAFVREAALNLGIKIQGLSVRTDMKNKWASCSTNGYLSFNAELLVMDEEIRRYVVFHELLHFSVPNHGKLWKSLMREYVGEDYEEIEMRLKINQ